MEDFDITKPSALFFGERDGLSEEILNRRWILENPDGWFTESLNISVSAAIIIQNLTNRLRNSTIDWHLSEEILAKRVVWPKVP
jgi:tRNA (guanosine-2'-O-)-methyltransferase